MFKDKKNKNKDGGIEMEFDNKLFNTLGYKLNSKEELLSKANELFISHQKDNIQKIKTNL